MKKEKPKYSVLSNISYSVSSLWQAEKSLVVFVFIGAVMRIALPFAGILTPKIVIDEITAGVSAGRFLSVMGFMAFVLVAVHFVKGWTDNMIGEHIAYVNNDMFMRKSSKKLLTMDYENREEKCFIEADAKARRNLNTRTDSPNLTRVLSALIVNVGGLIIFGGVIALIHPLIILLLVAGVGINWLFLTWQRKFDSERWKYLWIPGKKQSYLCSALNDINYAKDIRLYAMIPWLKSRYESCVNERIESDVKSAERRMIGGFADAFMILIRDGAAYAFLTYLLLENKIGLGDFIMLFAAIGGLSGWIDGVVTEMSNLFRESLEQCYRRIMIDFPDISNFGQGVSIPSMETAPEIRLENVSYTYSGSETPVLENVNITIKPGERIAVVGINGAGKTTLIKLICGLYRPTTGRVLMAGLDIREYNRDEYFTLITAVFQDIFLLAESIIENVSQQPPDTTDKEKAVQCLNKAGLTDKINALPNGADTLLVREVHEHAVDLSGGEKQKLALARALYKDAPVMILDEPTSALDPIAENEMYRQYAALTEGKTSVYISHRLASTRFCDRILFLDGKTVAEEGSHDMLMKANGIYSQMYSLQASYYTEKKEGVGDE